MPETVTLWGERVCLEPLTVEHVGGLVAAATESRETYDFTRVPQDEASMSAYVRSALDDQLTGWALPFAIRSLSSGRVIGTSRFLDLDYWSWPPSWPPGRTVPSAQGVPSVAEIGSTWLAASAQRTGSNTEAKLLMLGHAFEVWKVLRVTLKTDARNERSKRAIERLGGRFEGVRRAHARAVDGTVRDTAYYSIIAEEWPAVRSSLRERLDR
ncbi:GNAT family N-acetyltransferase [Streptosporangium sp. NPDC001559]|uniref:GNAT family N-acetyltransferase n=1 Tax=Streptosporangium sp. NPDC001559 TaxID=3366187 RepID=UPI0036EBA0FB